jgi:UDP-N-acetylmuramoylalanine--D-glutamate ligase
MLDLLPRISPTTVVVLELSSFLLSILRRSPHIAVITNISPNHLDRHGTMEEYVAAKRHIVEHQSVGDHAVLNAGDPVVRSFAAATPGNIHWFGRGTAMPYGAGVKNGYVGVMAGGGFQPVMPVAQIPLLGQHNMENVLAALAASAILEIDPETMATAVTSFRPAPHRLQTVANRRGIRYVDDSIATSPSRAIVALQALDAPILLIAGGRDKHLPWEDFARLVVQKARGLFLLGEAASLIEGAVCRELRHSPGLLRPDAIHHFSSLEDAVAAASREAMEGDVVLLSPGCTSYDMFSNFEERGVAFSHAVEALDAVEA